ncbi:hypothetical protein CHOED_073 [Vibrio phage CHOED]|nr:hypothetical protein CHOED_073 [Vibrio phage CHOED]AHK11933.1 putative membrane protein [Vibrio phage CHOED]
MSFVFARIAYSLEGGIAAFIAVLSIIVAIISCVITVGDSLEDE